MHPNELSGLAVDIAYRIHSRLGPGLLEHVYEAAFTFELARREIAFTAQQGIPAVYEGENLGVGYRADIILENKVIIEIKSVELIQKVHHKILLTYMKLAKINLGLLINFNVDLIKDGICRKVNNLID